MNETFEQLKARSKRAEELVAMITEVDAADPYKAGCRVRLEGSSMAYDRVVKIFAKGRLCMLQELHAELESVMNPVEPVEVPHE